MSVGGARVRFTRARIAEVTKRVCEAADLVSRRLGYTPKA